MPTPQEALNYAKRYIGNMPLDDTTIKLRLLNDAHMKLWMAAPWRWSVGVLEEVTWANNTQDYNLASGPSDFLYLLSSTATAGEERYDLRVATALPSTSIQKGRPGQVAHLTGTPQKLRFFPVPTGYSTGAEPRVLSYYKKTATAINDTNITTEYFTTSGVPVEWFWVWQEIVLCKAMQFTHDPRLGGVAVVGDQIQYTGQYGAVAAAIVEMRLAEKKFFDSIGLEVLNG